MHPFFVILALLSPSAAPPLSAGCAPRPCSASPPNSNCGFGSPIRPIRAYTRLYADRLYASHPFANAIFKKGDSCPTSYSDVIAKLEEFDGENCSMRTAAVSETAQVMGKATNYRTVTTRDCSGRDASDMLFSLFGLSAGATSLPSSAEVISFDPEAGVFNYYDLSGGEWAFHGNSQDFVEGSSARCAGCHTGGGLIMKELDAPWLHWEGDTTTPGAADLIDANEDLGRLSDGIDVENMVREGNDKWLKTRVRNALERGDAEALLEPLFCTVELNINSGTGSPGGSIIRVPSNLLVNQNLAFARVDMDDDIYRAAIEASGQVVANRNGTPLKDDNGDTVVDTHFPFSFPARSAADSDYVSELAVQKVLDEEFANDVLAIDFTRPIFSEERCALKRFAPQDLELLDGDEVPADFPAKLRDAFIANIEAESPEADTPAGQFLIALKSSVEDEQRERARAFADACEARDKEELMADVLMVVSQRRDEARSHEVMEFAETLPVDHLSPSADVRLHPITCELVEGYVPHLTEGPPPTEGGCLKVAEVFYDAAGAGDNGREWIKLYNSCDDAQSLEGHSLGWGGDDYLVGGIDLEGELAGKTCLLVGGPTSDDTNGSPDLDVAETLSPNLQNSGAEADGVAIFDVVEDDVRLDTVPLDAVIYGESNDTGLVDGTGNPVGPHVGDAPAGSSISRADAPTWRIGAPDPNGCPDF